MAAEGPQAAGGELRRYQDGVRWSPESAVADQDVKDRPDPPDERDYDPDHLLESAHVAAPEDVDDAEDEGDRMQEDRKQHLDQKLHDHIKVRAGRGFATDWLSSASRPPARRCRPPPARSRLARCPSRCARPLRRNGRP